MSYLKQFWKVFKEFLTNNLNFNATGIEPVKDNEPLARYILSSNQFSRINNIVKPSAFMPAPNLQLSVFRIKGLDISAIWEIGEKEVVSRIKPIKKLYGMAKIFSISVVSAGLKIDPDNIPPRHANIIGWPQEKHNQKMIAIELASKALLMLKE